MSRRDLAVLGAAALVQVALATLPDTMGDLVLYRCWARTLAGQGLAAAYWPSADAVAADPACPPVDYPPLFPYILWATGHGLRTISADALEHADRLLDFLIRMPTCAASVLLAWIVYTETRRRSPTWAGPTLALLALNPAVVFDSAYWGQTDSLCAVLIAAALVLLVRGKPNGAWVAAAAAALAKPFAYPILPLLAVASLRWFGVRRTLVGAMAGAAAFAAALLPFLWIGRLTQALGTFFLQLDAMPYLSVNAHNLWWLVGRGTPWTPASAHPLGLSWSSLSLALFCSFLLATAARLWRSRDRRSLYVAASSVAFGFFVLSTHMHENHLFYVLPALALAGLEYRPVRTLFLALTVTTLANMALHDPFLTHQLRPYVPGPVLYLPQVESPPRALFDRLARLGYPWMADEMTGATSALGAAATLVNAEANVLLFGWWVLVAFRRRGFDALLEGRAGRLRVRPLIAATAVFVLLSGAPFLVHAFRYGR
ncbi:MAG TPA: glycosyltransferase 87 family protein [Vicinamibacteria bacterium]|nr:glycosyltransferase 87 family protein [Vicinamibacteria bacterium]